MPFGEFSPRAENGWTAAPLATRRQVADTSVRGWVIVYRVKTAEKTVWIEDILQVMIG